MEYKKRCNVCGKIYCYTDKDISNNKTNSAIAALSAVGTIASVFGGTRLDSYALNSQTDRYSNKVVDFNKCPFCNSSNTSLISDSEWLELQEKEKTENRAQIIQAKRMDINSNATADSLLKRTKMFLEEEEWDSASAYCEYILDIAPECAMAYVYKLMIDLKVTEFDKLILLPLPFYDNKNYQKAIQFADEKLKSDLIKYNLTITERNDEKSYSMALKEFESAKTAVDFESLEEKFRSFGNYKKSMDMINACIEKAVQCKYDHALQLQKEARTEKDYLNAKIEFDALEGYKDSSFLAKLCNDAAVKARKNAIYDDAVSLVKTYNIEKIENAIKMFEDISGWKDADHKKLEALDLINQLNRTKKRKKVIIRIISIISGIVIILIFVSVLFNKNRQTGVKTDISDSSYVIDSSVATEDTSENTEDVQIVLGDKVEIIATIKSTSEVYSIPSPSTYLNCSSVSYCTYGIFLRDSVKINDKGNIIDADCSGVSRGIGIDIDEEELLNKQMKYAGYFIEIPNDQKGGLDERGKYSFQPYSYYFQITGCEEMETE